MSERVRELSQFDALTLRMKKLEMTLKTKKTAEAKLHTSEGVREIEAEAKKVCDLLRSQLERLGSEASHLKFSFHSDIGGFDIRGPFRLRLGVRLRGDASNRATEARLDCLFYQLGRAPDFTESRPEPTRLHERTFRPISVTTARRFGRAPLQRSSWPPNRW